MERWGFVLTNEEDCIRSMYLNSTVNGNNAKYNLEQATQAQMGSKAIAVLFP